MADKPGNPHDLTTIHPNPTTHPHDHARAYRYCTGSKTPWGAGTHTRQTQDVPVKRHLRGEPGHTRDTQDTRAHAPRGHTDHTQTNFTTSQPSKPNDTPARARDGRNRGRLNSRKNSPWRTAAGPEPTAPRGRPVYSTRYAFTWCGVGFEGAGIDENLSQNNNLCLIFSTPNIQGRRSQMWRDGSGCTG